MTFIVRLLDSWTCSNDTLSPARSSWAHRRRSRLSFGDGGVPGSDMAKRRYLFFIETDDKKKRFNFRSWPFVIVMGLLLALLSIIDRGGLAAVRSAATG